MKTFKQHINIKETLDGGHVGTPDVASFEDGSIGVHNIHDPKVLERVNAFLGGTAMKEYITASHAVEEIRNNLMRIGLFVPVQETTGEKGNFTAEIKFGEEDLARTQTVLILMMMVFLTKKKVV